MQTTTINNREKYVEKCATCFYSNGKTQLFLQNNKQLFPKAMVLNSWLLGTKW